MTSHTETVIRKCPECGAFGDTNWHTVTSFNCDEEYTPIVLIQCRVCKLVFDKDEIISEKWEG